MVLDSKAFNTFFTEYRQRFIRFADGYLHDLPHAEDLVIDSMMTFWKNHASLPQDTNIPAYVLTVLKNKCIDSLRHQKLHDEYTDHQKVLYTWDVGARIASLENFVPEEVFTREIETLVNKAVATLSPETRKAFLLSRREGKTNREIALLMGISEKGVEYHISKVNRLLRDTLKDYLTVSVLIFFLS